MIRVSIPQKSLFGMNVVFTGPAHNPDGSPVVREALVKACNGLGMTVHASIRADTELLVASRTDTVKAAHAEQRGIPVVTYDAFISQFLGGKVMSGNHPQGYVDKLPVKPSWTGNQHKKVTPYGNDLG